MKRTILALIIAGCFLSANKPLLNRPSIKEKISSTIDEYLQSVYQNHTMPGFSVVVTNKREIIFTGAYGYTQMGGEKRFSSNTVNPIGSLTKSITALAILQLVELGKVGLDEPVKKYIPSFTTANPQKSDRITIRMLLNNTSGLGGHFPISNDMTEKALEGLLHSLANSFIISNPGLAYEYSNIGFSIAGQVVARVSGKAYADYIETNIFEPLRMEHSSVLPIYTGLPSTGHFPGIHQPVVDKSAGLRSGEFIAAGQFAQSSARDLANYLRMYLNQGVVDSKRILSASLIEKMWLPQIEFVGLSQQEGGNGEHYKYGLGWMISEIDGRTVIHHGGSTGTASSFTMIDPKNQLAVSLLTNVDLTLIDRHQYAFGLNIVNNILHLSNGKPQSDFAKPTGSDPTVNKFELAVEKQDQYLGAYEHKVGGDQFVYYDNPDLVIKKEGMRLLGVISRNDQIINEFLLDFVNPALAISRNIASPGYLRFIINGNGKINGVYCFGMELRKVIQEDQLSLERHRFGVLECPIPSQWLLHADKKGFVLSHFAKPAMQIEYSPSKPVVDGIIVGSTTTHRFTKTQWEKTTTLLVPEGSDKITTTFTTSLAGQRHRVNFTSDVSEHTYFLQQVAKPILEGIRFL